MAFSYAFRTVVMRPAVTRIAAALLFAWTFVLISCNSTQIGNQTQAAHLILQGRAMGGEQPITGATIQLWTVNTSTTGGASTALLSSTITTSDGSGNATNANANAGNDYNSLPAGFFNISSFSCTSSQLLYLTASQGVSGTITSNNPQIQQMLAVGTCAYVESSVSNVVINEITTVGTVAALHSYMTGYNAVGSSSYSALTAAFTTASEYINLSYGTAPGPSLPNGAYASTTDLTSLADVIYACVNSDGGSYNDGSICGKLFYYSKLSGSATPTETVGALLQIFSAPTHNVVSIFNLIPPTPPFTAEGLPPVDWSLPILQTPSTPVISPGGGSITSSQTITIADSDTDALNAIYYTTDGTTPTTNSTVYTGPFTLSGSATVNAIDIDDIRYSSAVASASFTITEATPTVSLASITVGHFGTTTPVLITASSNATSSVVTFGTAGTIGGSFSPTTCTIVFGTCSVSYTPSGLLGTGLYSNDLTASFSATGTYASASATSSLTVEPAPTDSLTLLHSFAGSATSDGSDPYYVSLVQGTDGNFYGTSYSGGTPNNGTVFELTPNGTSSTVTILYKFEGIYQSPHDGSYPYGGLVVGRDGNLYGTTYSGGTTGYGTIFKIVPNGASSTYSTIYTFAGGTTDGANPIGSMVLGADGNLYGTTYAGGAHSDGTAFEFVFVGQYADNYEVELYSFAGGTADGSNPYGSLVEGTDGNFYGTTYAGGAHSDGTVFEIVPNNTSSTETVLHSFAGGTTDGLNPVAGLVQGTDGNFYGTTYGGGAHSDGTAFELTPNGVNSTVTLLHSFAGGATDGQSPKSPLLLGSDGNFYGTTYLGGASSDGTVFELKPNGASSTVTLLHSFAGGTTDGSSPWGGLTQGKDGNFYGTTELGGASGFGTIFEISGSPALLAPVTLTAPSSVAAGNTFTLDTSVANAYAASPNYGTMENCFAFVRNGATYSELGTFTSGAASTSSTMTAPTTGGTYTLGAICGGQELSTTTTINVVTDNAGPPSFSPVEGTYDSAQSVTITTTTPNAKIYYTTNGTIPTTSSNVYTAPLVVNSSETINALVSASGYNNAVGSAVYTINFVDPVLTLNSITSTFGSTTPVLITASINANGSVVTFGTAGTIGGSFSPTTCTVSNGSCSVTYTPSGTLAAGTYANDITATDPLSLSTAYSTLTIVASTTDTFTLLHSFAAAADSSDGSTPWDGLIQGNDGNFYGTTYLGGTSNLGTIYELIPNGANSKVIVLHSFTGTTTDGSLPFASLIQGSDGNFYGSTGGGGANGDGTVYELVPNGTSSTFTILHSFSGTSADGAVPRSPLVQGVDGNFYGTTIGTSTLGGTIYELVPNGASSTLTALYSGFAVGQLPWNAMVQGADGNFYGSTVDGGTSSDGVIYELVPNGASSTYTVLTNFASSGPHPYSRLIQNTDGDFYGATQAFDFKLVPNGTSSVISDIGFFTGTPSIATAQGGLIRGTDGIFYGLGYSGGTNGDGAIYQIVSNTPTILYSFAGGTTDGKNPVGSLVQGADGNFYGVAFSGGANSGGSIFELAVAPSLAPPVSISSPSSVTAGSSFTLSYAVSNAYSVSPYKATMAQCFAGVHNNNTGAYTKLGTFTGSPTVATATLTAPSTIGTYTLGVTCGGMESSTTTLNIGTQAATPVFSLAEGSYATTQTVSITTATAGAAIYYTTDGSIPTVSSNLYSSALPLTSSEIVNAIAVASGYANSAVATADYEILPVPTVSLSTISTPYQSTASVALTAYSNANGSVATFGTAGSIGGTFSSSTCTVANGSCSVNYIPTGTVSTLSNPNDLTVSFSATGSYQAASATATFVVSPVYIETVLHNFIGTDGSNPNYANMIQGNDGYFYGTTSTGGAHNYGTVYQLKPNGVNSTITILHSFAGGTTDGQTPESGLIQGADGNFYGMTEAGGAHSLGIVFQLVPNGTSSTITILHSFAGGTTDGEYPYGTLVQDASGNFYGTTYEGGAHNSGTVFELVPNGTSSTVTILHSFATGGLDGAYPYGGVIQGADGNFYGNTWEGGDYNVGAAYKIVPNGTSSTESVLWTFESGVAGNTDLSKTPLVQGTDGNFYGTTPTVAFELVPNGASSTLTILHTFAGGTSDGGSSYAPLLLASDGNFYGTTALSGAHSDGAIFQLIPNGASSTESLVYSFGAATNDGTAPWGGLVQGGDGNFYGTTTTGGTSSDGTLYEVSVGPALAPPITLTAPSSVATGSTVTFSYSVSNVYSVSPYSASLAQCFAGLHSSTGVYTPLGSFNGTPTTASSSFTAPATVGTYTLGVTCGGVETTAVPLYVGLSAPTVSLSPSSTTVPDQSTAPITTFTASSNATGSVVTFSAAAVVGGTFSPTSCTIAGGSCSVNYTPSGSAAPGTYTGSFTANFGATSSYGTASASSSLTIEQAPTYTSSAFYSFAAGTSDGQNPRIGMIQGSDGNYYGTVASGGAHGLGVVYELVPNGTSSTETILHSFAGGSTDGSGPGQLLQGSDGNFYGVTSAGGSLGDGVVYELVPNGASSTMTILHTFAGGTTDGSTPTGLIQGADGNFYGLTNGGGAHGFGIAFKLVPNGTSSVLTVLHSFASGSSDIAFPGASFVEGADGNFYGLSYEGGVDGYGAVYEIVPNGTSSTITILHSFVGGVSDGQYPEANLIQGEDGNLYGTTTAGGTDNFGVVFKLVPNGTSSTFTILHSFLGGTADGKTPYAGLVQGSDGAFYGTTEAGAANGYGMVFRIGYNGSSWVQTILHNFAEGTSDGGNPWAALVQGSDGNFYGTAVSGGANSDGVIFQIGVSPSLPAPVNFSAPSTVTHGTTFTINYSVGNDYSHSPYDATLSYCFAGLHNSSGTSTSLGTFTGTQATQSKTLTAPATTGTYTLGVTCGGQESSTATLTVQ